MALRSVSINYTLYTPAYSRETGLCLDFQTLERAKRYARGTGPGCMIVRNFNLKTKGRLAWTQDARCWYFDGVTFDRLDPGANQKKWEITPELLRHPRSMRTRLPLTPAGRRATLRRLRRLPVVAIAPR